MTLPEAYTKLQLCEIPSAVDRKAPVTAPETPLSVALAMLLAQPSEQPLFVVDAVGRLGGELRFHDLMDALFPYRLAAGGSFDQVQSSYLMIGIVRDLMHQRLHPLHENSTLGELARQAIQRKTAILPVTDAAGRFLGQADIHRILATLCTDAAPQVPAPRADTARKDVP